MNKLKTKNNYIDVTDEYLKNATPNSHKVKELKYFEYDAKKYYVDNKNVVLDYSKKELEIANWLESTFGGKLYMLPRINKLEGIETPDYLWNNEYWDLKEIFGNGKNSLDTSIKKKKNQANNFIIDITKSKLDITTAERQIKDIFTNSKRKWINIIIIKNKNHTKIYKKRN